MLLLAPPEILAGEYWENAVSVFTVRRTPKLTTTSFSLEFFIAERIY